MNKFDDEHGHGLKGEAGTSGAFYSMDDMKKCDNGCKGNLCEYSNSCFRYQESLRYNYFNPFHCLKDIQRRIENETKRQMENN